MTFKKFLLMLLIGIVFVYYAFFSKAVDLETVQSLQLTAMNWVDQYLLLSSLVFSLTYILLVMLSLPVASWLTLLAGAVFGPWLGLFLVSFSSSIGAVFAFLIARYFLRDWMGEKFKKTIQKIESGFKEFGPYYLMSLRLMPVFPFFIVNIVFAALPIRAWTFYWVSQLGMFPATCLYVFAGNQLASIEDVADIISFKIFLILLLMGLFPLLAKWISKRYLRIR